MQLQDHDIRLNLIDTPTYTDSTDTYWEVSIDGKMIGRLIKFKRCTPVVMKKGRRRGGKVVGTAWKVEGKNEYFEPLRFSKSTPSREVALLKLLKVAQTKASA